MIQTDCYLIIQPERRGYDGRVQGVVIDRMVKSVPRRLGIRDIALHVVLQVDERMFMDPKPEVTIVLDDQRAMILPAVASLEIPEQAGEQPENEGEADDDIP